MKNESESNCCSRTLFKMIANECDDYLLNDNLAHSTINGEIMPDNKPNEACRKVIKSIAAGGAIVAGKSLPEEWCKPVVDYVFLPVHAQKSPPTATVT